MKKNSQLFGTLIGSSLSFLVLTVCCPTLREVLHEDTRIQFWYKWKKVYTILIIPSFSILLHAPMIVVCDYKILEILLAISNFLRTLTSDWRHLETCTRYQLVLYFLLSPIKVSIWKMVLEKPIRSLSLWRVFLGCFFDIVSAISQCGTTIKQHYSWKKWGEGGR